MPGLLKIGFTLRTVGVRKKELKPQQACLGRSRRFGRCRSTPKRWSGRRAQAARPLARGRQSRVFPLLVVAGEDGHLSGQPGL